MKFSFWTGLALFSQPEALFWTNKITKIQHFDPEVHPDQSLDHGTRVLTPVTREYFQLVLVNRNPPKERVYDSILKTDHKKFWSGEIWSGLSRHFRYAAVSDK